MKLLEGTADGVAQGVGRDPLAVGGLIHGQQTESVENVNAPTYIFCACLLATAEMLVLARQPIQKSTGASHTPVLYKYEC